jgi:tRNA (adenine57-N1/adenine58-N1)-methyltransferase
MEEGTVAALRETDGKVHLVLVEDREIKVRGIGRINPIRLLNDAKIGQTLTIGQKEFLLLHPGLPEFTSGMRRRAQIITPKDASLICTRLGLGTGHRVLEAGLGSAGMALHIAHSIGGSGLLVSIELRPEHAAVALENLELARAAWKNFPDFHLIEGDATDAACAAAANEAAGGSQFDAIIIDLPEPWDAVPHLAPLLQVGGRLSCYCPVSSQLERAWEACEDAGLAIEWAGERIDRGWTKASRGGVRPGNDPMGHTAFILVAQRLS